MKSKVGNVSLTMAGMGSSAAPVASKQIDKQTSKQADTSISKPAELSTSKQTDMVTRPWSIRLPVDVIEFIEKTFAAQTASTGKRANRSKIVAALMRDHLAEYLRPGSAR